MRRNFLVDAPKYFETAVTRNVKSMIYGLAFALLKSVQVPDWWFAVNVFGFCGKRSRQELPPCAVQYVRINFPESDEANYKGFEDDDKTHSEKHNAT